MKVKVKGSNDIVLAELKQAIVSQSKEQLGEARDRITLSMPGTNCGLFFRVIPRKRNFMVSVKSSE